MLDRTKTTGKPIPDSRGMNAFAADPHFRPLLDHYLGAELTDRFITQFETMGELVGDRVEQLALTADKNPPVLKHRARDGSEDERIEKHPAYEELEEIAYGRFGLAAMSHRAGVFGHDEPLPPLVKYALVFLFVQAEFGLCCPLSMTDSLTRTLRKFGSPDLVARFIDGLTEQDTDRLLQGAMFMTEQRAGSDVGATETRAVADGEGWRLYGDKWFCSNADAGLAMVLARPEGQAAEGTGGLSLFLLPRHLPDGRKNAYRIVRLKDKLGTRSMASGEITLEGAYAHLVGEPGEGFRQMTDMINMSRLANGVRSAGLMRRSVAEACFIAAERSAFGQRLSEMPLVRRNIAKMMLPAEAARTMVFHTARVLRAADQGSERDQALLRILTPLIKFRVCRDARKVAGDAMEMRGGCGYIEEWSDARVLRDSHLGSIWEGTSNIVALDVARASRRTKALSVLSEDLDERMDRLAPHLADRYRPIVHRAVSFMGTVANDRAMEIDTRKAASALYRATAAVLMAEEATAIEDPQIGAARAAIADAILTHQLMPLDPMAADTLSREMDAAIDTMLA